MSYVKYYSQKHRSLNCLNVVFWSVSLILAVVFLWLGYCTFFVFMCLIMGWLCSVIRMIDSGEFASNMKRQSSKTISVFELERLKKARSLFIGWGFLWEKAHREELEQVKQSVRAPSEGIAMQALGLEKPLYLSELEINGHCLVTGTTGAGKTQFVNLLLTQLTMKDPKQTIIVFDPKGDDYLFKSLKALAGDRFKLIDQYNYAESICVNVLSDYTSATEIATRVSGLLPQNEGSQPFTAACWDAVNTLVKALEFLGEKPNLVKIQRFLKGDSNPLIERVFWHAIRKDFPGALPRVQEHLSSKSGESLIKGLYQALEELYGARPIPQAILLLWQFYSQDSSYFLKMTSALNPVLSALTEPPLDKLLSPGDQELSRNETFKKLLESGSVIYIRLQSMSDKRVGFALGALFLETLASLANTLQTQNGVDKKVTLFIDEAASLCTDALINLLNKGRSFGYQVIIATQTIKDFEASMGSEAKAKEFLANTNTKIFLRTLDPDTQQFAVASVPKVQILRKGVGHHSFLSSEKTEVNTSESVTSRPQEVDLIPSSALGTMPNLHYVMLKSEGVFKGRIPVITPISEDYLEK